MSRYDNFKFSVTIHSDDITVIESLSAFAWLCEPHNKRQIAIATENEWKRNEHQVSFYFSADGHRQTFIDEAKQLFQPSWKVTDQQDENPPRDSIQ
jgi:hypothetical protein